MRRPHWYFLFTIEEGNPDELVMKLIVELLKNCDQRTITGDMGDGLGLLLDQVVPTRRTLGLEPATQPRAASSGTPTSCLGSHGRAPADVRDVCHDLDGLVEPAGAGGGARPAGGPCKCGRRPPRRCGLWPSRSPSSQPGWCRAARRTSPV